MLRKLQKAHRIVFNTFGVLGIVSIIWYGINNANKFGVTIILFGDETGHFIQQVIDSMISFISDVLPYMAFFGGILALAFIIAVPIIGHFVKKKEMLSDKHESAESIASKITELSKQLEDKLKTR